MNASVPGDHDPILDLPITDNGVDATRGYFKGSDGRVDVTLETEQRWPTFEAWLPESGWWITPGGNHEKIARDAFNAAREVCRKS